MVALFDQRSILRRDRWTSRSRSCRSHLRVLKGAPIKNSSAGRPPEGAVKYQLHGWNYPGVSPILKSSGWKQSGLTALLQPKELLRRVNVVIRSGAVKSRMMAEPSVAWADYRIQRNTRGLASGCSIRPRTISWIGKNHQRSLGASWPARKLIDGSRRHVHWREHSLVELLPLSPGFGNKADWPTIQHRRRRRQRQSPAFKHRRWHRQLRRPATVQHVGGGGGTWLP